MKTISVVMPCLNEETTVGSSIVRAKKGVIELKELGYSGEIIVVDNGSTDKSVPLAKKAGAKVIIQKERGYGSAYKKGITAAKGQYIVIGDSDGTYDFRQIPQFIEKLREAKLI